MINNLCFTYASFLFFSLFLLIYFMKRKITSTRNKLYNILIIINEVFIISEIIYCYFGINNNSLISNIFNIFHWICCDLFFYFLLVYSYYISSKNNDSKIFNFIKNNKFILIISIVTIIKIICEIFVFNDNSFSLDNIIFGHLSSSFYALFISIILSIVIYSRKKIFTSGEKFAFNFSIFMCFVVIIIQLFLKSFSFVPITLSMIALCVYYNSENSDIFILDNISKLNNTIDKSNLYRNTYLTNMKQEMITPVTKIRDLSLELNKGNYNILDDIINLGDDVINIVDNSLGMISLLNESTELINKYSFNNFIYKVYFYARSKSLNDKVSIVFNVDPNIKSVLYGNENELYLAIRKLIDVSAYKTYVGKITISFYSAYHDNSEELHIRITDTSNGFKKEEIDSLNDESKIVDINLQNIIIAKKYVNNLHGNLLFNSESEVGNNFEIIVNQKVSNNDSIGNFEGISSINFYDLSNLKIAFVDNDDINLTINKRLILNYKNNCDIFNNLDNFIDNVKFGNEYDLIFINPNMNNEDYSVILSVIKSISVSKNPLIIAVSCNAINGMRENYLKAGYNECLIKPFDTYDLDFVINKVINNK